MKRNQLLLAFVLACAAFTGGLVAQALKPQPVFAGEQTPIADALEAKAFRLIDKEGNVRASLSLHNNDADVAFVLYRQDQSAAFVVVGEKGRATLDLCDTNSNGRVSFSANISGAIGAMHGPFKTTNPKARIVRVPARRQKPKVIYRPFIPDTTWQRPRSSPLPDQHGMDMWEQRMATQRAGENVARAIRDAEWSRQIHEDMKSKLPAP